MKYYIAGILILLFINSYSQNSIHNESWVKINAERKDGSRIIDRSNIEGAYMEYIFSNQNVFVITDPSRVISTEYTITGNNLKIGNFQNFSIEKITDLYLVLLENLPGNLPDDKINRYYFTKKKNYVENILNSKKITIENDSIICTSLDLFPAYLKGKLLNLMENSVTISDVKNVKGNFIISPENKLLNVKFDYPKQINEEILRTIENALNNTEGVWLLPINNDKYYYKMSFNSILGGDYLLINFFVCSLYNVQDSNGFLTIDQINMANLHYDKGVKFSMKKKYEKAIEEYTKCIQIDSIYLDAYYNRAYSNYQLKNYDKACEEWKYLKELGQKSGENYYKEYCK